MRIAFLSLLLYLYTISPSKQFNKIGGNVDGIADYSRGHQFCDLVKQSRTIGIPSAPWIVNDTVVVIGTDGWPVSDFGIILWIDLLTPMNGTYKMTFSSSILPKIQLVASSGYIKNIIFDPFNKQGTADLIASVGNTQMMLSFTNTNGGVRNLQVIRPQCDQINPPLYTTHFLQHHKQFNTLRFMDWGRTNGNSVRKWNERTLMSHPTMTKETGVCWEYQIELANQIQRDIWINIPYFADDDYIINLAILIKDQLDSNLNVYIELSNEIWNWQFWQAHWNLETATNLGNQSVLNYDNINNPGYWAWRLPAKRIIEIANIFKQIHGTDKMMTKIRPILAGQIAYSEGMKTALTFINNVYGKPGNYIYAIAGAPYFNIVQNDNITNLTVTQILDGLGNDVNALKINSQLLDYVAYATFYDLKLMAYESGPDTFGPNNIKNKKAAAFDPIMQYLCENYLEILFSYGFDLVNWFVVGPTSCDSQYGCWGLTELYTMVNTSKIRAINNTINKPKFNTTIGINVPNNIDGRQSVGRNFFGVSWKNYSRDFIGFSQYLVRSETQQSFYLVLNISTLLTKIKVEVNNNLVAILDVSDTKNRPVEQNYLVINLKSDLNVIRLKSLNGSFVLYNMIVSLEMPLPIITSSLSQLMVQSIFSTYQIVAINNPISFDAYNLPMGLTIDKVLGVLSGQPIVYGNFSVIISALNSGGQFYTTLNLVILSSVLLTENFNYTNGLGLNNLNGGYGFSGPWKVQNADSNPLLSSNYIIETNMVTGGGAYLTSGRLIDVSYTFSMFKDLNDIGAGGKVLWVSIILIKYGSNNEPVWMSLSPQLTPTYAWGSTRISIGYFGSESNDADKKYWSIKYGDNSAIKSSKPIILTQMALLIMKLDLNDANYTDNVDFFVNPVLESKPVTPDVILRGINVAFRNMVYYAGSSTKQSSMVKISFGVNYQDVIPTDLKLVQILKYPTPIITSSLNQQLTLKSIPFVYQITVINDITSYQAYFLPAGLSINTLSGLISGTPTSSGNYSVIICAKTVGSETNATFSLIIFPSLLLAERFDYTNSLGLNNLNGGYGFSGPWKVQNADSNPLLSSYYIIETNMVTGGGAYLTSGRLIDVSYTFSMFKDLNDIGAGGKVLWVSVNFVKYVLNNEQVWMSLSPQSSPTYAWGSTRISMGYFGSESNNASYPNQKYWSIKYGDNPSIKSKKEVIINKMTLLIMKLELNNANNTDSISFFVDPNISSFPDIKINNINIAFRAFVYYAGSSTKQSSMDEIRIGVNLEDVI
jgi:hypothetical protein